METLTSSNSNPEHKSINTSGLTDDQGLNNIIDESNQKYQENQEVFDVAIIGGGFSGLSAALLLGRYLRQTVIFDSGPTRNFRSKHIHAYLGFENSSPTELIQKARYLIIATGVQDSKPNVRNFEMFEGNSAWHCPHCDGFQSINKKLAIITYGKNFISLRICYRSLKES